MACSSLSCALGKKGRRAAMTARRPDLTVSGPQVTRFRSVFRPDDGVVFAQQTVRPDHFPLTVDQLGDGGIAIDVVAIDAVVVRVARDAYDADDRIPVFQRHVDAAFGAQQVLVVKNLPGFLPGLKHLPCDFMKCADPSRIRAGDDRAVFIHDIDIEINEINFNNFEQVIGGGKDATLAVLNFKQKQINNGLDNLKNVGQTYYKVKSNNIIKAYKEKTKEIIKHNKNETIKLIKEYELIDNFEKKRKLIKDESKINGYIVSKKIINPKHPILDVYSIDII